MKTSKYINDTISRLVKRYGKASDEDLVRDLIAGLNSGESLFYLLYGRYIRLLASIFLRLSKNAEYFSDLMAELELHLLNNNCYALRNFRGDASFSSWLSVTAHNLFVDKLPQIENLYTDELIEVDSTNEWINISTNADSFDELRQALLRLPSADQRIVIMKELEGYTPEEIAEILSQIRRSSQQENVSVNIANVYKIKQRARAKLEQIIKVQFRALYSADQSDASYVKEDDILYRIVDEDETRLAKERQIEGYDFHDINNRYYIFLAEIDWKASIDMIR